MQSVGQNKVGSRFSTGIAYVIIPNGQDKTNYIDFCFRNGCISILLEEGGIVDQVPVAQHVFNNIVFPNSPNELGSLVVWVNKPHNNQPIVVGVLNKNEDVVNSNQNQASLSKTDKNGFAEVVVDGKKTIILLNANSLGDDGGDIYIVSQNNSNTSKINVFVSGDINITAKNVNAKIQESINLEIKKASDNAIGTIIKYDRGTGFDYTDEFDNNIGVVEGKINIDSENINIGGPDAKEPILLGDKTVDMLDKILEILGRTTTATLIGPQPLITGPEFIALRAQLDLLKSRKHKIE